MVNWTKPILNKFIGPYQIGFVYMRKILDVVITTHEVIHYVDRRKNPGMALKLDISKAYDKVRREFLISILSKLSFNKNVIKFIKNVVNIVTFLVLVNGIHGGFFSLSQGLH